jgi:amino acid transporter
MASPSGQGKTFVRDATGLVKQVSFTNAVFFAFSSSIGIAAFSISFVALYPTTIIAGLPIFVWALLITAATEFFFGLTYVFLAQLMPRSGGDYVATSRIFSPVWGYIEAITYAGAWITAGALNVWFTIYTIASCLRLGALMSNGQALVAAGTWMTTTPGLLITSIPFLLFWLWLFGFNPTKTYLSVNTITIVLSTVASVIMLIWFVSMNPSTATIQSNLIQAAGVNSTQSLVNQAVSAGYSPANAGYTASGFGALLIFMVFAFLGYQNNFYIAGEIKGSASRATYWGIIASILILIFYYSVYWMPFGYAGGYDAINAWGFLFWTSASNTPFGAPPNSAAIIALANPSVTPIAIVLGIVSMTLADFGIVYVAITICIRLVFATSIDRLLPSWFASVNEKTATPVKTTVVIIFLTYVTFIANVFGLNPATTLYWSILLALPTYLFPSLNILLLKKRRPDLYELAPKNWVKKIAGLPAISWVALLWLVFAIPTFGVFVFYPIITSAAASSSILSYASSSGVLFSIVIFVLTGIGFYVAKGYNAKRGVDVGLIFKTIPPE